MNEHSGVQGDQPSGVVPGHFNQPGIVDLLMANCAGVDLKMIRLGGGPKEMVLEAGLLMEQSGCLMR